MLKIFRLRVAMINGWADAPHAWRHHLTKFPRIETQPRPYGVTSLYLFGLVIYWWLS